MDRLGLTFLDLEQILYRHYKTTELLMCQPNIGVIQYNYSIFTSAHSVADLCVLICMFNVYLHKELYFSLVVQTVMTIKAFWLISFNFLVLVEGWWIGIGLSSVPTESWGPSSFLSAHWDGIVPSL